MQLELVSIDTPGLPLDGVYYRPADRAPAGSALIFHGNCGNFYMGPPRFLPPRLAKLGLACLTFNRRGHDILGTCLGREPVGGAFQLAAEAIEDNRLAAEFLAAQGHSDPIVIGHSNGGLLAIRHVADHPATPAMVLLSAPGGGPRSTWDLAEAGLLTGHRTDELVAEAERLVAEGRPDALLQLPGWWWTISAASLLDRVQRTPDAIGLAPAVKCPTLYLKGSGEPEKMYPARAFQAAAGGPCDVLDIDGLNHWYNGREAEVGGLVASWLEKTLPQLGPRS